MTTTTRRPKARASSTSSSISARQLTFDNGGTPLLREESAEKEVKEAFEKLRAKVKTGNELSTLIAYEAWGTGPRSTRSLTRQELQILLEEAASHGYQPTLIRSLAQAIKALGVPLDWAPGYDCSQNFGRHALDNPLEAAVAKNRDERIALLLLDLGLQDGQQSCEQLNAGPLLRIAAGRGMLRVVEKLLTDCGADVNSKDPKYGSTALDRAADMGRTKVVLRLLELGADPALGKGLDYLLDRVPAEVRGKLPLAKRTAASSSVQAERVGYDVLEKLKLQFSKNSEVQCLQAFDAALGAGRVFSVAELTVLLEVAAKTSYRSALIRRLAAELDERLVAESKESGRPRFFGQWPLDAALRTAVEENPDERASLLLLDLRVQAESGASPALNANPLLRLAASRCFPELAERLVLYGGAEVDAVDPRFGSTALDRAVDAGCNSVAKRLLDLGANPEAGKGSSFLLERASPEVSRLIRERLYS